MTGARIAELLQPFLEDDKKRLSATKLNGISMYIDILMRWNARMNLTAIREPEEMVTRHFGESLFAARQLFPTPSADASLGRTHGSNTERVTDPVRLADFGSGAGFPGIPMKIWTPGIFLTLIESNHKKTAFLREIVRTLALGDVDVRNVRGESLPAAMFDIVSLRAVEHFGESVRGAVRLTSPGGSVVLLISSSQIEDAKATVPGIEWDAPVSVPLSEHRVFLKGKMANGGE
jgi:16S rRNA (guanine527-N7)-methyltransferase